MRDAIPGEGTDHKELGLTERKERKLGSVPQHHRQRIRVAG